ncbi:MAG TPA: hypothetical protein VGD58_05970 [Herpetosiphonaceae bacterium]
MNIARLIIVGHDLMRLVEEVQARLEKHYVVVHDPVVVLVAEQYYFRNNSTLQSTLVFAFEDRASCMVEIISGGGAAGVLNLTFGAEQDRNLTIVEMIRQLCASNQWIITDELWS